MFKPNNKKMLTVLMAVVMVFSALAILSFSAQAAYAASGTFTVNPTTYTEGSASGVSTIAYVSGGTFGAGSTVYFFLSNSTSSSGIVSGAGITVNKTSGVIGSVTLAAGSTSLANVVKFTMHSGAAPGNYYILAEDFISGAPSGTYALGPAVTIVKPAPTISIASTVTVGSSQQVTGSGFDPGASVTIYLNYPGSSVVLGTTTASSSGVIDTFVTIPALAEGSYIIVAQETNALSATFAEGGITADASIAITPVVSVSPESISGATTSTFTLNGYGFPADDSFAASTALNPEPTISFDSVDALNPAFTSSSSGSFAVTVTGLSAAVTTYGPASISLKDTSGVSYKDVGSIIVSVPNPSALGFIFNVTPTTTGIYNVNDSVTIEVWDFPASQNVQFYLGAFLVGSLTSDSNGAGVLSTVVPPIPGAKYTPTAVVSSFHLTTEPTTGTNSYTISPYFEAVDPSGTPLLTANSTSGEYVPSNGLITIKAYGLNPALNTYDAYDSLVAASPTGVYYSRLVTSISVGTGTSNLMQPAPNGTLIFTYSPGYSGQTTGDKASITFSSSTGTVSGYDGNSYAYYAIGSVTFTKPSALSIIASGETGISLSVSGLIPYTAALYPGVVNSYNAYIGSTELTLKFTNPAGTVVTGTVFNSGDSGITFTAPSVTGLLNLSITYNGQSVASAPGAELIVISSSGSSPGSGSLVLVPTSTGYDVVGFGYDQAVSSVSGTASSVTFYYMSYGATVSSGTSESLSNGAFVDTSILSSLPAEPAGTYAVFTVAVASGINYYVYSSYSVKTSLTLSPTSGAIGSNVSVKLTGLDANEYYNVYFAGKYEATVSSGGNGSASTTISVPLILLGTYNVSITPIGSPSSIVASEQFTVSQPSTLSLASDQFTAFPGELVDFKWTPGTEPPLTSTTPIYVTVYLNSSAYETVLGTFNYVSASPNTSYITGSFKMPNGEPNTLFAVSLGWSTTSVSGSAVSSGSVLTLSPSTYTGKTIAALELVNGTGASIVSISNASIAHIITSSINSALAVPLSELSANITALHGDIVTITTA
ncbi:MAG: hypothetical protein QXP36_07255, partial [Conexivisphaerales archaeon]